VRAAAPTQDADESPSPSAEPDPEAAPELPDDLDARVRLIGEWQLGEGY